MPPILAADLPSPASDRMVIYILGGGVGESVVISFPDGRIAVVDCCGAGSSNLPRLLLARLGVTSIDLLVLSHPDLDHVRGFAELTALEPKHLWRYPHDPALRDFVTRWAVSRNDTPLAKALRAVDQCADGPTVVQELGYLPYAWPGGAAYRVVCLAPTDADRKRAMLLWERMLKFDRGRSRLEKLFAKGMSVFGDAPNVLSLALAIEWGDIRVILGGDVMRGRRRGPGSVKSGWKGIAHLLGKDPDPTLRDLLKGVKVVKVAHHGSKHSFEPSVWNDHATGTSVNALIAPFTPSSLPDNETLQSLRGRVSQLVLSSADASTRSRLQAAGWMPIPDRTLKDTRAALAGVVIESSGVVQTFASAEGGVWH